MPEKPQGDSAPESGAVDAPVKPGAHITMKAMLEELAALEESWGVIDPRASEITDAFMRDYKSWRMAKLREMIRGASTTPDQHGEAPTGSKDKDR